MLRTTIYLDEKTVLALRHLADAQGRSRAEIIREALERYLHQAEGQNSRPLPTGIGAYRSGRTDVSARAEELLKAAAKRPNSTYSDCQKQTAQPSP